MGARQLHFWTYCAIFGEGRGHFSVRWAKFTAKQFKQLKIDRAADGYF